MARSFARLLQIAVVFPDHASGAYERDPAAEAAALCGVAECSHVQGAWGDCSAAAAVAGFVLTAVPNWTGRLPLRGGPLLFLVGVWLAGRVAVTTSAVIGGWTAAVVDVAFLAVLLAAVAREIVAGRNWRNLPIVAALAVLCGANVAFHIGALTTHGTAAAARLAIAVLIVLICLIGGRIIPSFTRNWLTKRGQGRLNLPRIGGHLC